MKRLLLCLAFVLLASTAHAQLLPDEWVTEGIKTNPVANTVLCQHVNTSESGETLVFHFVVASTVSAITFLEHIAADGTTVIAARAQAYIINAGVTFEGMTQKVTLDIGERVRLRTFTNLSTPNGGIQCSLLQD